MPVPIIHWSSRAKPLRHQLAAPFLICSYYFSVSASMSTSTSAVATGAGHPVVAATLRPAVSPRVLSIQSHTVHGYVGNKAFTFPLQCLGFNVDCINTVSLSNHPGYPSGCKGARLNKADFSAMIDGLEGNSLLNHDLICSGYTSSAELLLGIEETVKRARSHNPNLIYLLDPVLGDLGQFYVPQELVDIYKLHLLPQASAITPNQFEAEVLSGIKIQSLADAVDACNIFHDQYAIQTVVLTGLKLALDRPDADGHHSVVISRRIRMTDDTSETVVYRKIVETIPRSFSGCGDLLSSLMANFLYHVEPTVKSGDHTVLAHVLDALASAMSTVLHRTQDLNSKELCVVESMETFRQVAETVRSGHWPTTVPSVTPVSQLPQVGQPARQVKGKVAGIIFDVDGTLTEPGAIDFAAMYRRIGLSPMKTMDLIFQVEAMADPEARQRAHEIIVDEEMKGVDRMALRPDLLDTLAAIQAAKVPIAISTRNCDAACRQFIAAVEQMKKKVPAGAGASTSGGIFAPIVTRDSLGGLNKPDPRVSYHIFREWGLLSHHEESSKDGSVSLIVDVEVDVLHRTRIDKFGDVWFVGDSLDDLKCGRASGCRTCLVRTDSNDYITTEYPELVDLTVTTLSEFVQAIGLK